MTLYSNPISKGLICIRPWIIWQHINRQILCLLLLRKIGTMLTAKESKITLAFLLQIFLCLFLFQLRNSIFLELTYQTKLIQFQNQNFIFLTVCSHSCLKRTENTVEVLGYKYGSNLCILIVRLLVTYIRVNYQHTHINVINSHCNTMNINIYMNHICHVYLVFVLIF